MPPVRKPVRFRAPLLVLVLLGGLGAASLAACGAEFTVAESGGNSPVSTSTTVTAAGGGSSNGPTSSSTPSGGGGAGQGGLSAVSSGTSTGCQQDDACKLPDDTDGLCKGAQCKRCTDVIDDAKCKLAYDAPYLCLSGVCTPGDCRDDSQCSGEVCDTNTCKACDPRQGGIFLVDPLTGDDKGNGSGQSNGAATPGCAFKTVTHAIAAIGTMTGATIVILSPASGVTVGPGEKFPLALPAHTLLTTKQTDQTGGNVTIKVPTGKNGFELSADGVTILGGPGGLTVSGNGSSGTGPTTQIGLSSIGGSTSVENLALSNFGNEAINITAGAVTVKGVDVSGSGVVGSGAVSANYAVAVSGGTLIASSTTPDVKDFAVHDNSDGGIQVVGMGVLSLSGATTMSIGSIVVESNPGTGISLLAASQLSTVSGVIVYKNGSPTRQTSGIEVAAGAKLKLRGSQALGNGLHGVHVTAGGMDSTGAQLAQVDLGQAPSDFGGNVLQSTTSPNPGAGVCFDSFSATLSLKAAGNTFKGVDCSAVVGTSIDYDPNCTGTDVGVHGNGTIVVTGCTYQ